MSAADERGAGADLVCGDHVERMGHNDKVAIAAHLTLLDRLEMGHAIPAMPLRGTIAAAMLAGYCSPT